MNKELEIITKENFELINYELDRKIIDLALDNYQDKLMKEENGSINHNLQILYIRDLRSRIKLKWNIS